MARARRPVNDWTDQLHVDRSMWRQWSENYAQPTLVTRPLLLSPLCFNWSSMCHVQCATLLWASSCVLAIHLLSMRHPSDAEMHHKQFAPWMHLTFFPRIKARKVCPFSVTKYGKHVEKQVQLLLASYSSCLPCLKFSLFKLLNLTERYCFTSEYKTGAVQAYALYL